MGCSRCCLVALVLGYGCGFSAPGDGNGVGDGDGDGDGDADAATADAPPAPQPIAACPLADQLSGCFLFDDDLVDGSQLASAITASQIGFEPGVAGQAGTFAADDRMTVGDGDTFDQLEVTIEVWLKPAELPVGMVNDRAGIADVNGQWSMFLHADGRVHCSGNGEVIGSVVLDVGVWHHVACVFSSSADVRAEYVDGAPAGSRSDPFELDTGQNDPLEIGSDGPYSPGVSDYIGAMDNLLIWTVARTPAELCETAGIDC